MSEKPTTEPTMDEILASIRRIISEDPAPADHAPVPAFEPERDVDRIAAFSAPPETQSPTLPIDHATTSDHDPEHEAPADHPPAAPAVEEPVHEEPMTDTHAAFDEPLVGAAAASASASAFDSLATTAHNVAAAAHPAIALPPAGRTLEDLTADLLRPLLKTWLDENLAEIVRDRVDEEVRRIARSRVR